MARPRIPLRAGWATKIDTTRIWNETDLRRRKRLNAIELIWDADSMFSRTRLAELAGVSRRQLHRWITAFNDGGLQELLYPHRRPLGRSRRISVTDFNRKVRPLVQAKETRGIPWSVKEVRQTLAAQFDLQVSARTLRRYLARSGFRPTPRPLKPKREEPWTYPWPRQYGRSLGDFLQKSGQTLTAIQ